MRACLRTAEAFMRACLGPAEAFMRACLRPAEAFMRACLRPAEEFMCACQRPAEAFMRACLRSAEAFMRNAHVSETHISSTFPCTKRRKQSSPECCRHIKVIPIPRRSPFPSQTDTQTVSSAFFEHGNGDMHACLRRG